MATEVAEKRVYRARNASIGGVCAGLAERFDLDPIVVRILFVLGTALTLGLGVIVYAVLWARLPREPESSVPYEIMPESAESNAFGCVDCATGRATRAAREHETSGMSLLARLAVAAGLMLLFLLVAVNLSPLMPGTEWWQFWPLSLLIIGLCLIVIPIPSQFPMTWHAVGIVVTSVSATLLPMSLNIMSWNTIPHAFQQAGLLIVIAAALFAYGLYRQSGALVIIAAFIFVGFCLYALMACALPGAMDMLTFSMPDGRSIKISFVTY